MTVPDTAPVSRDRVAPRARFRDLLAAEWIKLWSLRSTRWSLPLVLLLVAAVSANAALADHRNWPTYSAERRELFRLYGAFRDAFPEAGYLFFILVTTTVGAMTVVGEYQTGLIRTTFATVPARRSVVAAKAVVLSAVMLILGALTAAASSGVSQAILSGRDANWSVTDAGVPRALAATALLAPVCALIGMGLGALLRHTAAAVGAAMSVLVVLPLVVDSNRYRWVAELHNALPTTAWLRLIEVHPDTFMVDPFPATVSGSWTVYAAWPLVTTVVALTAVHHREP
ncbi:ABC transporter permease subunit [Micromonospora sp. DT47]|uniref:ABC transporter permease subunit n=1 Tax=Micromonospora sp. DT47 TaxID=3393431 RepID=UPI003CF3FAF7